MARQDKHKRKALLRQYRSGQEDCRALVDLYPDAETRHRIHYTFAHRFLPQYVLENPCPFFHYLFCDDPQHGAEYPTRFIQARWQMAEELMGVHQMEPGKQVVFRRVSDLSMWVGDVQGRPAVVVMMPTPERQCEAYYVGAVLLESATTPDLWSTDAVARVFTLEASDPSAGDSQRGVVCEWTNAGEHRNYGLTVEPERGRFLEAVAVLLQAPETRPAASYDPNDRGITMYVNELSEAPSPAEPGPKKKPWWRFW